MKPMAFLLLVTAPGRKCLMTPFEEDRPVPSPVDSTLPRMPRLFGDAEAPARPWRRGGRAGVVGLWVWRGGPGVGRAGGGGGEPGEARRGRRGRHPPPRRRDPGWRR